MFIAGFHSRDYPTEVGCPQGSILGPLLWSLGMENLLARLQAHISLVKGMLVPKGTRTALDPLHTRILRRADSLRKEQVSSGRWPAQHDQFAVQPAPVMDFAAYADDLTLWVAGVSPHEAAVHLQLALDVVVEWAREEGVPLSKKTEARWISFATNSSLTPSVPVTLSLGDFDITIPVMRDSKPVRILGLLVDWHLTFEDHIQQIHDSVMEAINSTPRLLPPTARHTVLKALCLPHITRLLPVIWSSLTEAGRDRLRAILAQVARTIIGAVPTARAQAALLEAGLYDVDYEAEVAMIHFNRRLWMLGGSHDFLYHSWNSTGKFRLFTKTAAQACSPRGWIVSPPGDQQRGSSAALGSLTGNQLARAASNVSFHTRLVYEGVPVGKETTPDLCLPFNLSQLRICPHRRRLDLWTDGSVSHSGGDPTVDEEDRVVNTRSGGSWIISSPGLPTPVLCGDVSLGTAACSYSMEREALRDGISQLLQLSRSRQPAAVRIISDSLSCLRELEAGPYSMREEASEAIWASLSEFACEVHLIFIFSHVEGPEGGVPALRWAVEVDKRAELALSASPTRGPWPLDHFRDRIKEARQAAKARVMADPCPRARFLGPARSLQLKTGVDLPRRGQVLLFQLRTGACPQLGGWRHEEPVTCKFCGTRMGRQTWAKSAGGEVATEHLFACPAFPTTLTPTAPWSSPVAAVEHLKAYLASYSPIS